MKSVVYSKVHPNPAFKELVKENDRVGARTLSIKSPSSSSFLGRKSSKSSSPQSQKAFSSKSIKNEVASDDQAEFYKKQCKQLKEQLKEKEKQISSLKEDNEHLRTLNLGYHVIFNKIMHDQEVIHKKVEQLEKITIDKEVYATIYKSDVKQLLQKMENSLHKVEQQLRSFLKHCKVMEADIEIYKKKSSDADVIVQGLKSTGEFSIDKLVNRLKDNDDKVIELESENRQLQYENCLNAEKLRQQTLKYSDIENNFEECKRQHQELILKHNRLISENEERKNTDHKTIYNFKCSNDYYENELRQLQQSVHDHGKERKEAAMKLAELTHINDTLRSTFMSTSKHNSNGFNVQFKNF